MQCSDSGSGVANQQCRKEYLIHLLKGDDVKLSERHAECLLFIEKGRGKTDRQKMIERDETDRQCQIGGHFGPGPCSI